MQATVAKFLEMYDLPYFPFRYREEVAEKLGLLKATGNTGDQFLARNSISGGFVDEVIQAATRVNYAQNLGLIHGLETIVCLATDGAMAVKGGNWQIFDRMIDRAAAFVRLNTTVTSLERDPAGRGYRLFYKPCSRVR